MLFRLSHTPFTSHVVFNSKRPRLPPLRHYATDRSLVYYFTSVWAPKELICARLTLTPCIPVSTFIVVFLIRDVDVVCVSWLFSLILRYGYWPEFNKCFPYELVHPGQPSKQTLFKGILSLHIFWQLLRF